MLAFFSKLFTIQSKRTKVLMLIFASANIDVDEQKRTEVETLLREVEEEIMKSSQYQGQQELDGWKGGIVWLVPTFMKIEEWKPVAERVLK